MNDWGWLWKFWEHWWDEDVWLQYGISFLCMSKYPLCLFPFQIFVVTVVYSWLLSSVIPQSIRPELPIGGRRKLLPPQQRLFAPTFFPPLYSPLLPFSLIFQTFPLWFRRPVACFTNPHFWLEYLPWHHTIILLVSSHYIRHSATRNVERSGTSLITKHRFVLQLWNSYTSSFASFAGNLSSWNLSSCKRGTGIEIFTINLCIPAS